MYEPPFASSFSSFLFFSSFSLSAAASVALSDLAVSALALSALAAAERLQGAIYKVGADTHMQKLIAILPQ